MGSNPTADIFDATFYGNMLAARFHREKYDTDRLARENPRWDWLPSWLPAFAAQVTKPLA